jgi:hypothetical protein
MRNRSSAPMPTPGRTLCEIVGGVGDGVMVAVGICVGVAVSGISVVVGDADGVMVGVKVGVAVLVGVGVNVHVGGIGVRVALSSDGGQGSGLPSEPTPQPPSCADTKAFGKTKIERIKNTSKEYRNFIIMPVRGRLSNPVLPDERCRIVAAVH